MLEEKRKSGEKAYGNLQKHFPYLIDKPGGLTVDLLRINSDFLANLYNENPTQRAHGRAGNAIIFFIFRLNDKDENLRNMAKVKILTNLLADDKVRNTNAQIVLIRTIQDKNDIGLQSVHEITSTAIMALSKDPAKSDQVKILNYLDSQAQILQNIWTSKLLRRIKATFNGQ
jgi:hypothetical protein